AITIIGYQPLYRWLTLLMMNTGGSATPPVLMKTAITRARLTELLGQDYFDRQGRDNLFIVGMFSMLDAIFEMPIESVLEKLNLPEAVTEALLTRTGIYGPFLELVEACEGEDVERINALAESLALNSDRVNEAHLQALTWAEALAA
ncbi:MAG: EAL and HDOD domain-containing protein, partial [Burkholderiales bacterium]